MNVIKHACGWIEVICGSMFSGKTEELLRRVKRAEYAKQKIQVFKPAIDNRFDETDIVSHSKVRRESMPVNTAADIAAAIEPDTEVIAIDEAQFFDDSLIELIKTLADDGKRVIVAGLDMDYRGMPFGPMPQILAIAEYVTKVQAICVKCGNPASRTQRLVHNSNKILVGAANMYEARCRRCHTVED